MAMFLAEIAFLLEIALFGAGLAVWHQGRQGSAGLLRGAGAVLVIGSVLTALCTGYFSVRYHMQGDFDHAYASSMAACSPAMMEMHEGMQQRMGTMMGGPRPDMGRSTPMAPSAEPEPRGSEHEQHHGGSDGPDADAGSAR